MSHQPNLAITLPEDPLIFAAPVAFIVLLLAIMVIRKRRAPNGPVGIWTSAANELGIELITDGSDLGPVARGRVNSHVVMITPAAGKGRKNPKLTQYGVKFEAPEAPPFVLVRRGKGDMPNVDTGNPNFDTVVSVQTEHPDLLSRFLTGPRRAAILRLLTYWPSAEITNREARLTTPGIEEDFNKLVDSVCHLVAAAEIFDRPTFRPEQAPTAPPIETHPAEQLLGENQTMPDPATSAISDPATTDAVINDMATTDAVTTDATIADMSSTGDAAHAVELGMEEAVAAARAIYEAGIMITTESPAMALEADPGQRADESDTGTDDAEPTVAAEGSIQNDRCLNGDADRGVLTDVRLDEIAVLSDLFNSGHDPAGITARFHQVYQGRAVNWSGEVLRVGATDDGFQRIAALVGSADGQNPDSGRVVALTAVGAVPVLAEGDVVSFSGSLVNLDASQRLFQIA